MSAYNCIVYYKSEAAAMSEQRKMSEKRNSAGRTVHISLVREILLRLPIKSVVRFRIVEKAWRSLIMEEKFVRDHQFFNSTRNPCIIVNKDEDVSILSKDKEMIVRSSEDFQMVGCVRGLVCLRREEKFMLWNPAMGKSIQFSLPLNLATDLGKMNLNLNDVNNVGVCFDLVKADYKVVVCYKRSESSHGIVYSFAPNTWEDMTGLDNLFNNNSCQAPTVILNDCPYWTNHSSDSQFLLVSVLKFDVRVVSFKCLPQFRIYRIDDGGASCQLVNMNSKLTILAYENKRRACPVIDVFCLEDEESGVWNAICKVGPIDFQARCMWSLSQGFGGNELLFREPGGYFLYDIKSKNMKYLPGATTDYVVNCFPYAPTLALLPGMN